MIICFHGTSKSTAERILKVGFQKGTYFARHLETALSFGGPYVFYVRFEEDGFNNLEEGWWQFHLAEKVGIDKIWKLLQFKPRILHENPGVVE